jgi:hypothetical protein
MEHTVMIELPCVAILLFAAAFHFYWGLGGRVGWQAALPQRPGGERAFTPRSGAAHAVGLMLVLAVLIIGMHTGVLPLPVPAWATRGAVALMSLVFLVRAFGWFRYAGWFKTVRDTRFGRYDTWFYCPLCLALGLGLGRLAWSA